MAQSKSHLIGIGNAAIDVTANVPSDDVLKALGFEKGSCVFPDKARAIALMSLLNNPLLEPGGMAANVLCVYAAFGGRARFIGKTGRDAYGEQFAASIRQWGVAFDTPPTDTSGSTMIFTLISPDGERSFGSYYGASHLISTADVSPAYFDQDATLVLDCYMLMSEGGPETLFYALDQAREKGASIVFMPASPAVIQQRPDDIARLAASGRLVLCNDEEAQLLTRTKTRADALSALMDRYQLGAMTLGPDGAYAFEDGRVIHQPNPYKPDRIVNTNGAGDHFAGAFLFGLHNGMDLEARLKLSLSCALEALNHHGPRPTRSLSFLLP